MTKLQEPLLDYVRRKEIEAKHGLPYKDCFFKEFDKGCVFNIPKRKVLKGRVLQIMSREPFQICFKYHDEDIFSIGYYEANIFSDEIEILGHPISLAGIMQALEYLLYEKGHEQMFYEAREFLIKNWKRFKDGKELYFSDQTPETQEAIGKLLGYEAI